MSEKIGPLCCTSVLVSLPEADQMRARPSYEPVASREPEGFQSSVVTSLLFSFSLEKCCSTAGSDILLEPSGTRQMRAVESPEPEARSPFLGFHAQMNTSFSCPSSVVTCS